MQENILLQGNNVFFNILISSCFSEKYYEVKVFNHKGKSKF